MKVLRIVILLILPCVSYLVTASEETGIATGKSDMNSHSPYRLHRFSSYDVNRPIPQPDSHMLKIAFYNLLTKASSDSNKNPHDKFLWQNRLKPISQLIIQDQPDVLGYCEAKLLQIWDLKKALTNQGYAIVGYDRDNGESIEIREKNIASKEDVCSGEFVGVMYKNDRLIMTKSVCYNLEPGEKHNRILVYVEFFDMVTQKHFAVLTSHFDHRSTFSIEKSGEQERALIVELEEKKMPWFSIGDRNWFFEGKGEEWALQYASHPAICDFRDETELGHFGPYGTYSGYNKWAAGDYNPPVVTIHGQKVLKAPTIDVGFRSRTLTVGICSYTLTGEFSPETYDLLSSPADSRLEERNFASDHFYIGSIVRVK